jgi:hypothetical protein
MEPEHLVIHKAPQSPILSTTAGADALSLCTFFMTLQGGGPGDTLAIPGVMRRAVGTITLMTKLPPGEHTGSR